MAGPNAAPGGPQYTKQDLHNAYAAVLGDLNDAYWAASDLNTKDRIYGNIEAVSNILTQLDAADIQARDAQYSALVQQVSTVNKSLSDLQQQINTLITRISTAATIASDIAKVVTVAAKVFAAV